MHGKISHIQHDNRGCFKGLPQGIESTRYHSLSASHVTLPPTLAITSIAEKSGVIMGVRHRKYTLEAVQYHPESILSSGGDALMRNFLSLRGGLWEENPESGVLDTSLPEFPVEAIMAEIVSNSGAIAKVPSILEKIYTQRLEDSQSTSGTTLKDLQTLLSLNIAPPLVQFQTRIKQTLPGRPAFFAEIKRASPSKGPIALSTSPAAQSLKYALSGAQVISVLTEPKWFHGSLQDMLHARQSVAHLPNRPAILRKDFILNRYQVLESRLWGADTILLIVSMLPEGLLRDLYTYSVELGMEPLVEVNSAKEMDIALSLPAKVIGVNNRNLHDFTVDMGTTSRLSGMVKEKDVILCALSGISSPDDVNKYVSEGVGAVLVGESLMRADDPVTFIRQLLSLPPVSESTQPRWRTRPPLVKICGIRSKDEAIAVAEAGADMLGLMFVEVSKRRVCLQTAKEISEAIRSLRFSLPSPPPLAPDVNSSPWLTTHASRLSSSISRPLLVGVFQNSPLETILHITSAAQLDIVQLHGSEPIEWAHHIPVPVIRVFHIGKEGGMNEITRSGVHQFVLLDSIRQDSSGLSGGSGKVMDLDIAKTIVDAGEVVLEERDLSKKAPSPQGPTDAAPTSGAEMTGYVKYSSPAETWSHHNSSASHAQTKYPLPIILAGGLAPDNIANAIAYVRPWAVDVSGGVESADGKSKDLDKVRAFIKNAKEWIEAKGD
jgi:anthranilate synthase/indole-3-glycerol phosphate synthase/phosphoribosylanthranilate isomerase